MGNLSWQKYSLSGVFPNTDDDHENDAMPYQNSVNSVRG